MYRILLVDDELLVRTNLKLLLHSFSQEFSVCAEAPDGSTAMQLIDSLQPDIVISDIRMPKMNGLELCKIIKLRYPNIIFIALSNYDDYEYVRGALKNGAIDYILKHKLNHDTISAVIQNIKQHTPQANLSSVKNSTQNTLNTLRNKFVFNLLSHMFLLENDIVTNIKMLDIHLDTRKVVPIILSVDNYSQIIKKYDLKSQSILEFAILNIGNEILSQFSKGILAHVENENYCILLSFADVASDAKTDETLHLVLQQISVNLKSYLNISTSYSIGNMCPSIDKLEQSYEKAKKALQLRFYSGNHSILHSDDLIESKEPLSGLDFQIERNLLTFTASGDFNKISEILDSIFLDILNKRLSINNAQMIFADLISILTRMAKEKDISLDSLFQHLVHPSQMLTQLTTLSQIKDWFKQSFQSLCQQIQVQLPGDSEYVRKAIGLINKDFSKPISQQTIADEIGISSGYLSTIFKMETGQGFSDYLNSIRISMATRLLGLGEIDLHKVAIDCGFQDYTYFFKVFKKKLKLTPKEYLKNSKNG